MAQFNRVNPQSRVRFVLKKERELAPEQQTVWILRPLTNLDRYEVLTHCGQNPVLTFPTEQLRRALVDVENLKDANGPVKLTRDIDGFAAREFLGGLEFEDLFELVRFVVSGLTEVDTVTAGKS